MTKLEIINETIKAYSDPNNRATTDRGCVYLRDDGKMCAVGRCFKNSALAVVIGGSIDELELPNDRVATTKKTLSFFKKKYQGHGIDFWVDLQLWHDDNHNFGEDRISEKGLEGIETLKLFYAN